jgi:excisionase family DNA binding protein
MNKSELLVAIAGLPEGDPRLTAAAAAVSGEPAPDRPVPLRLFKLGEACKEIHTSRPTLRRMIQEGRIQTVEIRRGAVRIPESELRRIVEGK